MINIVEDEYAPTMVDRDQWVVYATNSKKPRAPWKTGTLYLAQWGQQLEEDEMPHVPFDKAKNWEGEPPKFLPGSKDVNELNPGYLLSHNRVDPEENIIMVDLDDCRDHDTGDILDEALGIANALDSYTEVSISGEGLHVFVHGRLPEYVNSIVEPLETNKMMTDEKPKIEIYEASRVCITTGRRVTNNPGDVEYRDNVIDDLVDKYYEDDRTTEEVLQEMENPGAKESNGNEDSSPYYDVSPTQVLLTASGWKKTGGDLRGPHPAHGSGTGNNTKIEAGGETWRCWRHEVTGNALQLVAVIEGYIQCEDCGSGGLDRVSDVEYANVCIDARDKYGFGGKPPYRAVRGAAIGANLMSEGDERLGDIYDVALQIYENAEEF